MPLNNTGTVTTTTKKINMMENSKDNTTNKDTTDSTITDSDTTENDACAITNNDAINNTVTHGA